MTRRPRTAAWAPWDDSAHENWKTDRDALAVSWLVEQAAIEGSSLVVQGDSHAADYRAGVGPLAVLARHGEVATYRSPVSHGATVVSNPDIRLLAQATQTAGANSLVAIESPAFPLKGWAMAMGALNLASGEPTFDERTERQVSLLQDFESQLYNGWAHRPVGRRATNHYLPLLAESGMEYAVFVGSLIAVDPHHLDSNAKIDDMVKALPPAWADQRLRLMHNWSRP